jgi:hypothetical protein
MADAALLEKLAQLRNPWYARMSFTKVQLNVGAGGGNQPAIVPFDTIIYDPGNICTLGSNAGITIPQTGLWYVCGNFAFNNSILFDTNGIIYKNGQGFFRMSQIFSSTSVTPVTHGGTFTVLQQGDYIQMYVTAYGTAFSGWFNSNAHMSVLNNLIAIWIQPA